MLHRLKAVALGLGLKARLEMVVNRRPPRRSVLPYPHRFCCAPTRSSNKCWLCRFMALSWLNRPCGPKAAIGIGKRTLGHPRQSAALQGPQQGLLRVREPIFEHARDERWPIACRHADERILETRLGRAVRHERTALHERLLPAA